MLTISTIERLSKLPRCVIEALLNGVSKADLEALLVDEGETLTPAEIDIRRMNAVGSLRAFGYVIPRMRGHYQITGFEEKREIIPASEWTGRPRAVLEWLCSCQTVLEEDLPRVQRKLAGLPLVHTAHENCSGYLWCYELARDTGYFIENEYGSCIAIQKFITAPRLRIFNTGMDAEGLLLLAKTLSLASLQAVGILNLPLEFAQDLKKLDPKGYINKRQEAIYSTWEISEHPERFLNKRALTQLRKNQRDTYLVELDHRDTEISRKAKNLQHEVVDIWKQHLERRHRQLAITRDYIAIEMGLDLSYVGMREGISVSSNVLDQLPNRPDVAADLMNKARSYSEMKGGRPGTSDWALHEVCKKLLSRGVEWYQAGSFLGGGEGLEAHKKRYCHHEIAACSFVTSFPHLRREDITKWL